MGDSYRYKIPPAAFLKAIDDYRRLGMFTGEETYHNIKELAIEAGYSVAQLDSLAKQGAISAKRVAWRGISRYLFSEEGLLSAVENLKNRPTVRNIKAKHRTIDDLAEESGYRKKVILGFIRERIINASEVKLGRNWVYAFDESQFQEALGELKARAKSGYLHTPHNVRIRRRLEFQNKVKSAYVDKHSISFSGNSLDAITKKDELKMRMLAIQGDEEAFNELLRLYNPIIRRAAYFQPFQPGILSLEERIMEGQLSLWQSISRAQSFAYARQKTIVNIRYAIINAHRRERKLRSGKGQELIDSLLV